MRLNEKDQEKLMLHMAGNLAKERRARGLKLNCPESVALISSELWSSPATVTTSPSS